MWVGWKDDVFWIVFVVRDDDYVFDIEVGKFWWGDFI